jgi:hypothetical protein
MGEVCGSDTVSEFAISPCATELLNPGVLIGGDDLGCELSSDPVRFFGEDDSVTEVTCHHRSRDASGSSAGNEYLSSHRSGGQFTGRAAMSEKLKFSRLT